MNQDDDLHVGHRDRLRQRFLGAPDSLSDTELLELLLTYAIPRKDTAPLAEELLRRFSSISGVLSASNEDLSLVPGIGENVLAYFKTINFLSSRKDADMTYQPNLFASPPPRKAAKASEIRVFANDEILTSLQHLPEAGNFESYSAYKDYLESHLPYNSAETRHRRANYILDRFYPDGDLNTVLTYVAHQNISPDSLKSIIFYHLVKAEPLLAKVAEELIFPALPIGKVGRTQIREFILMLLPNLGEESRKKAIQAILHAYTDLHIGREDNEFLKIQLHPGSLDAFVYILTSEFPEAGIFSFEALYNGPAHRWLLWDREWMRKQLYNLRDLHILSKVSEIDNIKQFSFDHGQRECIEKFFGSERKPDSLREE